MKALSSLCVTSQTRDGASGNSRGQRDETVAISNGLVGYFRLPVGTAQDEPSGHKQRRPSAATAASNTRDSTGRLPQCPQTQGYQLIACVPNDRRHGYRVPSNRCVSHIVFAGI